MVSCLLGALHPEGPYPILPLSGDQGAAKTNTARILRYMIDPNEVLVRTLPREERDLIIAARNGLIIALANVSSLKPWLSDALCRMATGGGFSGRQLYTDGEEVIFSAKRRIILTGIEDVVVRGDLADRAISIVLPRIPAKNRRTEAELWAEVDRIRPGVLGALLDAVSTGLRRAATVTLEHTPRMADFAKWIVAGEPSLPWKAGEFMEAYDQAREDMFTVAIEADMFANAIIDMMDERSRKDWSGTATQLLEHLDKRRPEGGRLPEDWPTTPQVVGGRIRRAAPLLRLRLEIEFGKERGNRLITITTMDDLDDDAVQRDNAVHKPSTKNPVVTATWTARTTWTAFYIPVPMATKNVSARRALRSFPLIGRVWYANAASRYMTTMTSITSLTNEPGCRKRNWGSNERRRDCHPAI